MNTVNKNVKENANNKDNKKHLYDILSNIFYSKVSNNVRYVLRDRNFIWFKENLDIDFTKKNTLDDKIIDDIVFALMSIMPEDREFIINYINLFNCDTVRYTILNTLLTIYDSDLVRKKGEKIYDNVPAFNKKLLKNTFDIFKIFKDNMPSEGMLDEAMLIFIEKGMKSELIKQQIYIDEILLNVNLLLEGFLQMPQIKKTSKEYESLKNILLNNNASKQK